MNNKVLVTDSLFIKPKHVKQLEAAGFEVVRLDKPAATEAELCEAVKGKVGYILGGVEKVTDKVIESADELKAIVFTGTGWSGFIPGHKRATQKGIAIGAAPHLNAHAVAEFGMALTLMMCRDVVGLARGGEKTFETTKSLAELSVGIVGLGHIGSFYAEMARGMGAKRLSYFSRTRKTELESETGIAYKEKEDLLKDSDVIFVALPAEVGANFFTKDDIAQIKNGTIIVSGSEPNQFDLDVLYERLVAGEIKVAFDENIREERFQGLPLSVFYAPNESSAYNTGETVDVVSESCVRTLINILATRKDKYRVN
jgi:phosphoglycerate dehydrogenase-like enzyme